MTQLIWDGQRLVPGSAPSPLVVDSYLVRDGDVVGLKSHEHRFSSSALNVPAEFLKAVRHHLPAVGDWFPRIEWYGQNHGNRFGLALRPAPQLRTTTNLWLSDLVDPRTQPLVKGPDLTVLAQLRRLAHDYRCDDALLVDLQGCVLEAANAAVVFWADEKTVILPESPVLPSITVEMTLPLWEAQGISVIRRHTKHLNFPAWCGSSLHGWTPVVEWGRGAGKIKAAPAPPVKEWNQALWEAAESC